MIKRAEDGIQKTEGRGLKTLHNLRLLLSSVFRFSFRLPSFTLRILPSAFFLLPSAFLLSSCENDVEEVNRGNQRKPNIEEAYNIQSFLSQNGSLRAKLISPFMLRYAMDTSFLEFPKTLHVNFFDSAGKVESQVDARYGKYYETRSQVYLRDSVVVFTVKGDTLWTPDLWWDQNTKKFYTANRVRIQRKGQHVVGGKGMDATQDLNTVLIYQIENPSYITMPDSMKVQ